MSEKSNKPNIFKMLIVILIGIAVVYIGYHLMIPARDPNNRVCEKEGRVLTERELIDNFLLGGHVENLSLEEKKKIILERDTDPLDYPECCYISMGKLENAWVVNEGEIPHYDINVYSTKHDCRDGVVSRSCPEKETHYVSYVLINECGKYVEDTGESISKEEYEQKIKEIRQYWNNQGE